MSGDRFVNIDDFTLFPPGFVSGVPGPSAFAGGGAAQQQSSQTSSTGFIVEDPSDLNRNGIRDKEEGELLRKRLLDSVR